MDLDQEQKIYEIVETARKRGAKLSDAEKIKVASLLFDMIADVADARDEMSILIMAARGVGYTSNGDEA